MLLQTQRNQNHQQLVAGCCCHVDSPGDGLVDIDERVDDRLALGLARLILLKSFVIILCVAGLGLAGTSRPRGLDLDGAVAQVQVARELVPDLTMREENQRALSDGDNTSKTNAT